MAKKDDLIDEAMRLNLIKNKTEGKKILVADLEQMIANASKVSPLAVPGMEGILLDPADPLVAPVNVDCDDAALGVAVAVIVTSEHCASCGEMDVPLEVIETGPRTGDKLCASCAHGEPIDAAAELIHERVGGPEFPDRGNLRQPPIDIVQRIGELESRLAVLRGQPNTRKERIKLNRGIRRLEART